MLNTLFYVLKIVLSKKINLIKTFKMLCIVDYIEYTWIENLSTSYTTYIINIYNQCYNKVYNRSYYKVTRCIKCM